MKRQYIAAVACLMAGAIGFVGVYSTERAQERDRQRELAQAEQQMKEQPVSEASTIVEPKAKTEKVEEARQEVKPVEQETETEETQETMAEPMPVVQPVVEEKLHFAGKGSGIWPLKGKVLLPYSMDSTIYFPTLDQYQYNPAMVIQGNINDKVYFIAKGKITDVTVNEETGCTVIQDLGDGYTAVYGQLKELTFDKGDTVECGQVVGYVSEPTKYYSVEGSNLYFAMLKDGVSIDPMEYLSQE